VLLVGSGVSLEPYQVTLLHHLRGHDRMVVSPEFPVFTIHTDEVLPEVLDIYFRTPEQQRRPRSGPFSLRAAVRRGAAASKVRWASLVLRGGVEVAAPISNAGRHQQVHRPPMRPPKDPPHLEKTCNKRL